MQYASAGAHASPPLALRIGDLRCSERYVAHVRCAGRLFLFSRHDLGDHKHMETLVRSTGPLPAAADAPLPPLGKAQVGLAHGLLMSHNAAFHCADDRILVAYGGMAHTKDQDDWQGNDVGIVRSTADATQEPLRWSTPALAVSGDKSNGCVDELAPRLCEYDGKVSVVVFKGRVLLFTRSNLSPHGGSRYVQVTRSAAAGEAAAGWSARAAGWSAFEQVRIRGFRHEDANNLYFWTVRKLHAGLLAAFFPGVIERRGGVYFSTSSDGLHWSRPSRLLP